MPFEFKNLRKVEFTDTDLSGIAHYTAFLRFMEATEHAFFRSLGHSVHGTLDGLSYGWPRLNVECSFEAPMRFEDDIEIHLLIRSKTTKTISYDHTLYRLDGDDRTLLARGSMTTICVDLDKGSGQMKSISIPKQLDDLLEVAPEHLLMERAKR